MKVYSAHYVRLDPSTNMVQVEEWVPGGSRVVQFPLYLAVSLVTMAKRGAVRTFKTGAVPRDFHLQTVERLQERIRELEAYVAKLRGGS